MQSITRKETNTPILQFVSKLEVCQFYGKFVKQTKATKAVWIAQIVSGKLAIFVVWKINFMLVLLFLKVCSSWK